MKTIKHTPTKNRICIFGKIVVKYYYLIQDRYYDKQRLITLARGASSIILRMCGRGKLCRNRRPQLRSLCYLGDC